MFWVKWLDARLVAWRIRPCRCICFIGFVRKGIVVALEIQLLLTRCQQKACRSIVRKLLVCQILAVDLVGVIQGYCADDVKQHDSYCGQAKAWKKAEALSCFEFPIAQHNCAHNGCRHRHAAEQGRHGIGLTNIADHFIGIKQIVDRDKIKKEQKPGERRSK